MTVEEAIGRIKEHIEIHYAKEPRAIYISEALYMGIDALGKQIPQKINTHHAAEKGFCPNCLCVEDTSANYCRCCGQALDWSDAE